MKELKYEIIDGVKYIIKEKKLCGSGFMASGTKRKHKPRSYTKY